MTGVIAENAETRAFRVGDALPVIGTTLLEASAGTGKTWTIGALVTRFVAEGEASLDEMLVITFGRAASQELRQRVRDQLVAAERALAHPERVTSRNGLIDHLLDTDDAGRALRRRRLRDALAAFDAATIATTHQFCQLVLRSLGVAGDTEPGVRLVEDLDELVEQVVDDLYLRRFGNRTDPPPFDRTTALAIAARAVSDPQARLVPEAPDPASRGGARVDFAHAVRGEVDRRKRRLGILSYDDLLSRLAAALEQPDAPARDRMRRRWRVVLVDEFQDTDPVQWDVIHRAFSGHARVVLIGDPKQAIYAFRGGDVATYLAATATASVHATLDTNWRSDADLVGRLQVVLQGAALGDPRIVVRPVRAHHEGSRLSGLPAPAPFRMRVVSREGFRLTRGGEITAADARRHIAADLAADVAGVLASGATHEGERIEAGDLAVIVSARDHGLVVQRALQDRGVPAVVAGGGHVLLTPAADQWLVLLEALEQPHRSARVRAAALTPFFGRTVEELASEATDDRSATTTGDALTDRLADTLRGWALLLRSRGVAALFEAAEERDLSGRVLAASDGERLLTDLRHVAQILHDVAVRERLGLTALLQWLRAERRRTIPTPERTRRLDSDAAAVQIVTVHGSKGLQYPVVYLPFAYERYVFPNDTALFHDDQGRRCLDVSGAGPEWADHDRRHQAEEAGEELRDLYVALTRAQSQVVAWWAPTSNTATGGLHRLLLGRMPGITDVPDRQVLRDDDYVAGVFAALAELGGPSWERSVVADLTTEVPAQPVGALAVRTFERGVDVEWRRTSYSGLIRVESTVPAGVTVEPEATGLLDEDAGPRIDPLGLPAVDAADPVLSPMADLPAGAELGLLVHAVLEHADPTVADLAAELERQAREQLRWHSVDVPAAELAAALVPMHHSPLGPLAPGLTLRDIPLGDRLRELDFELPLAGGDVQAASRSPGLLRDMAPLLRRHLAADDPLASYADQLEAPGLGDQLLTGYLAGSIDAVLRVPSAAGTTYLVVDWKTNFLGERDEPLTARHYTVSSMAAEMQHAHYPLQALLYAVVLHRYLRWRLRDYDPERHLGGVLYLFVRGMCGPETPVVDGHPAGVFTWRPPAALILELSDLLDGASGSPGAAA